MLVLNINQHNKYDVLCKRLVIKTLELCQILEKSLGLNFNYGSRTELIRSQQILINLKSNLIKFADKMNETVKEYFYKALTVLIVRKEFDIEHFSFDELPNDFKKEAKKANFKSNHNDFKMISSEIKIASKYEKCLYQALKLCLKKIIEGSSGTNEKHFIETFLAKAFFRIPWFRKKIIELLTVLDNKSKRNLTESFVVSSQNNVPNTYFLSHFDWENEFYENLKHDKRSEKNREIINTVVSDDSWVQILGQDQELIFSFISQYCKYVKRTVQSKESLPWIQLPGYQIIKNIVLQSLNNQEVLLYPISLISASSALLGDESVIKDYFYIMFSKIE